MKVSPASNPFAEFVTHEDVMRQLGASYFVAYSLGASGALGEPVLVGRTKLFPRAVAEAAISLKLADRRARESGR